MATCERWPCISEPGVAHDGAVTDEPSPRVPAVDVAAENRIGGNPKSEWDVSGAGDLTTLGFATAPSVHRRTTIDFKVNCPVAFDVAIYRLGYYAGDGARKVATVAGTPAAQPAGRTDPRTHALDCGNWTVNASWAVPAGACPGVYLARPTRTDTGGASHIPFVVREDSHRADIVVKLSDTTWQAYNYYGGPGNELNGASLYGVGPTVNNRTRARAVSFNRPYVTREHRPQTFLFNAEYPMLRFLERNGYDVQYVSSVDVTDSHLLTGRRIAMSSGHDEYWCAGMRDAFEHARDDGVSLAFFSGNEVFWRVRFDGSRRTMTCYKDTHDGSRSDPEGYTGTWRDKRRFNPDRRPESALSGQFFIANGIRDDTITVPAVYASKPIWRNTSIAGLPAGCAATLAASSLGFEWDESRAEGHYPDSVALSETRVDLVGARADDNGDTYTNSGAATHQLLLSRAPSGTLVFATGTVQWAWGLDATHDRGSDPADVRMQQATVNILADLGARAASLDTSGGLVPATAVPMTAYGLCETPADTARHIPRQRSGRLGSAPGSTITAGALRFFKRVGRAATRVRNGGRYWD